MVSAYYSPLPGQNRYLRGSYEGDIRLNGRGVAGADGTSVYTGMLAAPKTYIFGTKIYIPGLGIGTVHDRGGAILSRANYDRIDVWMGYGDEGLTRALNWGMRMIEGNVYLDASNLQDNLNYSWVPGTSSLTNTNKTSTVTTKTTETFQKGLGKDSMGEEVEELQTKLKELGYFNAEPTGTYGMQTIEAVFAFQKEQGILSSWNDYGAGYFGNQTRKILNKIIVRKKQEKGAELAKLELADEEQVETTKLLIVSGLGKDAEGGDVEELQKTLQELGYYSGKISGIYDSITIEAVFNFQKNYSVISDDTDYGAGYFGPKTKEALEKAIVEQETKLEFGQVLAQMDLQTTTMVVVLEDKKVQSRTKIFTKEETSEAVIAETEENRQELQLISATLQKGDKGNLVMKLQRILKTEGYLNIAQETDFFGDLTEQALIQYQLDKGIISSQNNPGAGIVGPLTRKSLNAVLDKFVAT